MTYREKLKLEHPEKVEPWAGGGCCGCPKDYGYGPEKINTIYCPRDCNECWSTEFKRDAFTKSDIKPCFLIELRNGQMREIYSVGKSETLIAVNAGGDWNYLSAWDDKFNYKRGHTKTGIRPWSSSYSDACEGKDIVKIYGLIEGMDNYKNLAHDYCERCRPLLWKRAETKKMTVSEVSKALGYEVEIVAEKE